MNEHYPQPNSRGSRLGAPDRRARRVLRVVLPIGVVALVLGLKLIAVESLARGVPFLLLLLPVIVAAWYGGAASGLFATVLAAAGAGYFFLRPYGAFGLPDQPAALHLSLFVLEGSLVALFVAKLQQARHATEAVAREHSDARSRMQAILTSIEHGITVQEPSGKLVYANDFAAALVGLPTADALLHAPLEQLMSGFELFDEAGKQFPRSELPGRLVLDGQRPTERVVRFRNLKTGEDRWSVVRAAPVLDEHQRVRFAVNVFRDITEEKRAQDRGRFIADVSSVLVSSLDYETTAKTVAQLAVLIIADWCAIDIVEEDGSLNRLAVAHVDPAKVELAKEIERRYPTPPHAATGVPKVIRTGQAELIPEITDAMLASAACDPEQLEIFRTLGLRSCILVPMIARGRTLGAITLVSAESPRSFNTADLRLAEDVAQRAAIAIDNARLYRVSERAREKERAALEQAQREAKVREELLSIVGHDLRNPLGAIKVTGAVLLQNPSLDDLTRKKVSRIVSVTDRMARLISQLLDFSRARIGGGLPLEPVETELNRICEQVIEEMRAANPGRSIHYESRGEVIGRWDPDRIAEVLSNLIGNAIQYGDPARAVTVQLSSHGADALIEVHNWGAPIPQDALSYIFEPFRRGSREKSTSVGLGLYIAQQIVVGHGGTIEVSSSLSEGTRFSARLPRSLGMHSAEERNPSPVA